MTEEKISIKDFPVVPFWEFLGIEIVEMRPGYGKLTVKAVSIKSTNERLEITLDVAALNDGVVVTSSGTAQSVDEVSKAVTVIDAQQIELRDEYSVLETLRAAPGVRVVQQSRGQQPAEAAKGY